MFAHTRRHRKISGYKERMGCKTKRKEFITEDWALYQKGLDYNSSVQYKTKADKNERFYAGDQWRGVEASNLPTPVFNMCKRICDYKISFLLSQPLKIRYTSIDGVVSEKLNVCADYHWEKDKLDYLIRVALLNAALSGDMCAYVYWNMSDCEGGGITGDFTTEIIDGIQVYFGNVNDVRVQNQPYILIAGRTMTDYLKAEARKNGLDDESIDRIMPDSDYLNQAGDRGSNELDGKSTYIIRFYKKNGRVYFSKSVRGVSIISGRDTGLSLYPIAWGNWTPRKNSYHGEAEVTSLISAQVFYNKHMAMAQKSSMDTAYPKILYDKTRLAGFSNAVGGAFAVNGDVTNAAKFLNGGQMDSGALELLKQASDMLYKTAGVTDALTGEMRPENNSAILALQKSAAVPLDMQKAQLYQFLEDIAKIWLDFIRSKYKAGKKLYINTEKGLERFDINADELVGAIIRAKIDIGSSSVFSEAVSVETLNGLLSKGHITLRQYLERLPKGIIPKTDLLLSELK